MAAIESFPGPSGVVDSVELRKDLAGLIVRDSSGSPRAGVFPRHANALVTATASTGPMTVSVAAFEAALVRQGGPLFMQNDGAVAVTIAAAPVSNSRIDVVYVKQNEASAPMSDANNSPVIGVVAGTAAASPVKPSIPVGALELATVQVPSGVTATNQGGVVITQTFQYTATAGGVVLFRSQTEQDAWLPVDGSRAYRLDVQSGVLRRNGAWALERSAGLVQAAAGTVTVRPSTYMKRDSYGDVEGYAEIERTTANGGITSSTVFAVMQSGFRPASTYYFTGLVIGASTTSCVVTVGSNGNVTFFADGSIPSNAQSFVFKFGYPGA